MKTFTFEVKRINDPGTHIVEYYAASVDDALKQLMWDGFEVIRLISEA
jgi:hypothetical protein